MRFLVMSPVMLIILIVISCGGKGGDQHIDHTPQMTTETTTEKVETLQPTEKLTVTIGNITDKTGPAAQAMHYIDAALADVVKYYNDNNLIPGIELKLEEYDTQYDPAKSRPDMNGSRSVEQM